MYMIFCDGFAILDKPMSLFEIVSTFGSVQLLESKGFTLRRIGEI